MFDRNGNWGSVDYWIDLGNMADHGQFVIGQPCNRLNKPSSDRLRTATELYPELMDISAPEDNLPSCSAAEALERQEPYINNVLATNTLSMLTQLLRYGQLSYQGGFYNAKSGRIVPIEAGFKEQKTRKRRPMQKAA